MTRVALARTTPSYAGLAPPWGPGKSYPELVALIGEPEPGEGPNPVYAAVRTALSLLGLDREAFGSEAWNPLRAFVRPGQRVVLKPNFIRHWNPAPGASSSCSTCAAKKS